MTDSPTFIEGSSKPAIDVERKFRVRDDLYLIGCMERGVTVYSQQVRSHNLVWALWEVDKARADDTQKVAIIGGGIAGLTAAACMLGRFPNTVLTLFERSWDVCPLQQGCDSRWLHPRIYDWPKLGSRAPSASLPVLNWNEGRASDVADQILRGFGKYISKGTPARADRLKLYLGVDHLRISSTSNTIEWVGREGIKDDSFFCAGSAVGESKPFDRIIIAAGFGEERQSNQFASPPYWRNEAYAQPLLNGMSACYVVSGYGDGALVDLCRLTIERFRQDRIVYDLFDRSLDSVEQHLRHALTTHLMDNAYELFREIEGSILTGALANLKRRVRKDTRVILHLSGKDGKNTEVANAFGPTSSFLNRLLLFLLYRCGAFIPSFDPLPLVVARYDIPSTNIICRYGPDSVKHIEALFNDAQHVEHELKRLKVEQSQTPQRQWEPGCFPN